MGKTLRTKIGLPVPTVAGITILILLIVSFTISLRITWLSNIAAADTKRESITHETELQTRLSNLSEQNANLQSQNTTLLSKVESIGKQNATLQLQVQTIGKQNANLQLDLETTGMQFKKASVQLDQLQEKLKTMPNASKLENELQKLNKQVESTQRQIERATDEAKKQARNVPTEPTTGWITVRNKYRGGISLWVDDKRTDLQENEGTSIEVRYHGSNMQLYSCGWLASQTSSGQAPGCRFISYSVLPGQSWEVVETPPAPRIVMRPIK